jgi:zeaxanthin glucosyltransferase
MRIGFVSLPMSGHLNPMTALARKLQSRGHEVQYFGVPDIEPDIRAAGLTFVSYGEQEYPPGSLSKLWSPLAYLHGLEVMRYTVEEAFPALIETAFRHLPGKLVEAGIDALVIDTTYFFVQLIPMRLDMPFVQIWNVLPRDASGTTPPSSFSWRLESTPETLARNKEGLRLIGVLLAPVLPIARAYAERVGLEIDWKNPSSSGSKLAVIAQTPKEFDYPGIPLSPVFHYTGPFHEDDGRESIPFAWERLNGKPLVYASLGTLVNGLLQIHKAILGAAERLPEVQFVFSIGRNIDPETLGPIPLNMIVVATAPQIELLKRAALCITHAGLNTTLESLSQGVPMIAIPIGYDQPGVAARIAYHGVGEFVEVGELSADGLTHLIEDVLSNPSYRDRSRYFQRAIAETRGLDLAAEIVEEAFQKTSGAIPVSHRKRIIWRKWTCFLKDSTTNPAGAQVSNGASLRAVAGGRVRRREGLVLQPVKR